MLRGGVRVDPLKRARAQRTAGPRADSIPIPETRPEDRRAKRDALPKGAQAFARMMAEMQGVPEVDVLDQMAQFYPLLPFEMRRDFQNDTFAELVGMTRDASKMDATQQAIFGTFIVSQTEVLNEAKRAANDVIDNVAKTLAEAARLHGNRNVSEASIKEMIGKSVKQLEEVFSYGFEPDASQSTMDSKMRNYAYDMTARELELIGILTNYEPEIMAHETERRTNMMGDGARRDAASFQRTVLDDRIETDFDVVINVLAESDFSIAEIKAALRGEEPADVEMVGAGIDGKGKGDEASKESRWKWLSSTCDFVKTLGSTFFHNTMGSDIIAAEDEVYKYQSTVEGMTLREKAENVRAAVLANISVRNEKDVYTVKGNVEMTSYETREWNAAQFRPDTNALSKYAVAPISRCLAPVLDFVNATVPLFNRAGVKHDAITARIRLLKEMRLMARNGHPTARIGFGSTELQMFLTEHPDDVINEMIKIVESNILPPIEDAKYLSGRTESGGFLNGVSDFIKDKVKRDVFLDGLKAMRDVGKMQERSTVKALASNKIMAELDKNNESPSEALRQFIFEGAVLKFGTYVISLPQDNPQKKAAYQYHLVRAAVDKFKADEKRQDPKSDRYEMSNSHHLDRLYNYELKNLFYEGGRTPVPYLLEKYGSHFVGLMGVATLGTFWWAWSQHGPEHVAKALLANYEESMEDIQRLKSLGQDVSNMKASLMPAVRTAMNAAKLDQEVLQKMFVKINEGDPTFRIAAAELILKRGHGYAFVQGIGGEVAEGAITTANYLASGLGFATKDGKIMAAKEFFAKTRFSPPLIAAVAKDAAALKIIEDNSQDVVAELSSNLVTTLLNANEVSDATKKALQLYSGRSAALLTSSDFINTLKEFRNIFKEVASDTTSKLTLDPEVIKFYDTSISETEWTQIGNLVRAIGGYVPGTTTPKEVVDVPMLGNEDRASLGNILITLWDGDLALLGEAFRIASSPVSYENSDDYTRLSEKGKAAFRAIRTALQDNTSAISGLSTIIRFEIDSKAYKAVQTAPGNFLARLVQGFLGGNNPKALARLEQIQANGEAAVYAAIKGQVFDNKLLFTEGLTIFATQVLGKIVGCNLSTVDGARTGLHYIFQYSIGFVEMGILKLFGMGKIGTGIVTFLGTAGALTFLNVYGAATKILSGNVTEAFATFIKNAKLAYDRIAEFMAYIWPVVKLGLEVTAIVLVALSVGGICYTGWPILFAKKLFMGEYGWLAMLKATGLASEMLWRVWYTVMRPTVQSPRGGKTEPIAIPYPVWRRNSRTVQIVDSSLGVAKAFFALTVGIDALCTISTALVSVVKGGVFYHGLGNILRLFSNEQWVDSETGFFSVVKQIMTLKFLPNTEALIKLVTSPGPGGSDLAAAFVKYVSEKAYSLIGVGVMLVIPTIFMTSRSYMRYTFGLATDILTTFACEHPYKMAAARSLVDATQLLDGNAQLWKDQRAKQKQDWRESNLREMVRKDAKKGIAEATSAVNAIKLIDPSKPASRENIDDPNNEIPDYAIETYEFLRGLGITTPNGRAEFVQDFYGMTMTNEPLIRKILEDTISNYRPEDILSRLDDKSNAIYKTAVDKEVAEAEAREVLVSLLAKEYVSAYSIFPTQTTYDDIEIVKGGEKALDIAVANTKATIDKTKAPN